MNIDLIMGFLAGAVIGVAFVAILTINTVNDLREKIAILQVDLKYARREFK